MKGPIPLEWFNRAGALKGKALAIGLVLWYLAGRSNRRTVRVCLSGLDLLGLNEFSARRGIRALEEAGLIQVRRRPGSGLEVTLLDVRGVGHHGDEDQGHKIETTQPE